MSGRSLAEAHQHDLNGELLAVDSFDVPVRPSPGRGAVGGDADADGWSDRSEANRDCDPLDSLSHLGPRK